MRIVVIGTGYVGLVSGACLADFGHEVVCVDQSSAKIAELSRGQIPIHEPGLEGLVARNLGRNLNFSTDAPANVAGADLVILAVGTPSSEDGKAELGHLFQAVEEVVPHLRGGATLVVKSTVPVGTARRIRQRAAQLPCPPRFVLVSNPEFLREGSAIRDFNEPDRIVIGHGEGESPATIRAIYAQLLARGVPLVEMSNEAAELCKYASNTFLALRVAYVNEMADFCEAVGVDIASVVQGMALDRRIGHHYFQPGPGFGGSCFSKDISALLYTAHEAGLDLRIGSAVKQANSLRKQGLAKRVARAAGGTLKGKSIAVLGLAFKANTDDMRDSAALNLIADLRSRGVTVRTYDPAARPPALAGVTGCSSLAEAITGTDAAVIMTEWDEFRSMDLAAVAKLMRKPVVVDFRNLFPLSKAKAAGITYHSLGRATVRHQPEGQTAPHQGESLPLPVPA